MNRVLICATCAGFLVMLNVAGANAAKTKTATSKSTSSPEADSMQCRGVTITGMVEERETKPDAAGKVVKYIAIMDSKKNEWRAPAGGNSDGNIKDYVGLKVKAICMHHGSVRSVNYLASIKTLEALDKVAFEAKKADREETKKAAAEVKAAAAEAARKK